MLEQVDLSKKISKVKYKDIMGDLELQIGALQRKIRELKIPVIIVFEGWDAAGKGTMINKLLLSMDARGFQVYPINAPNEEERYRPHLWRFWTKTPVAGRIGIYDRSWYGRVIVGRVNKLVDKKTWNRAYQEIRSFERHLAEDNAVIIKFWLHIDQKEQKKRYKNLERNPSTAWKVGKSEWKQHRKYKVYCHAVEDMLAKTDTDFGPWTIVEAHDQRFAKVKIFTTVVQAFEKKVKDVLNSRDTTKKVDEVKEGSGEVEIQEKIKSITNLSSSMLDKLDMTKTMTHEEYKRRMKKNQARLRELEHEAFLKRIPVIIAYEGWDAGGKGGNIKRLVGAMDPRGYDVIPIAAPNDIEKAHHYLWRFWKEVPKAGHIAIFDRSWYGRVLVERIEGFCSEEEWRRSYREINEMEENLVNFGSVLVKFWIHITKEEQLKRFTERQKNEYKKWKITDEDWRNREKWDLYKQAVDDMLFRTSTAYAPWTIIEGNCKMFARTKALETVIREIEKKVD